MSKVEHKIIRFPQLLEITGNRKSSARNLIKQGLLPPPVSLGERAVGYVLYEVEQVLNAIIQGKTSEEIKSLVSELVSNRTKKTGV